MSGYDGDASRKGSFNLDSYNTVPERMAEAFAKYPNASLQSEVVTLPAAFADKFIAVKGRFFRTPDDPAPGEGLAWELVPGKTPYTKDSELQNAETSAWGRAIVAAFAADTKKGIASREEVANRNEPDSRRKREPRKETMPMTNSTPIPGAALERWQSWVVESKARLLEALRDDKEEAKLRWDRLLLPLGKLDGPPSQSTQDMLNAELTLMIGGILTSYEAAESTLLDQIGVADE